tara:strand:+ start:52 stop:462 length:411 start_codon:yes stop_codon:yes gene_type:complete
MSKKQLIQIGHAGEWVNPKYVTSIEPAKIYLDLSGKWDSSAVPQPGSKLWVVGNAGYGTYSICTTLSPKQVVAKLNEKEEQANARLIASAPEMLEMCKLFEECMANLDGASEPFDTSYELSKVRAVLAKVEGETSA